jgi:uncharacterized protein (DUF4415 family)
MLDFRFEWDRRKASATRSQQNPAAPGRRPRVQFIREHRSHHLGSTGDPIRGAFLFLGKAMRKEYDFSKSRKNPYASQLKRSVTIRLDEEAIDYFKSMSEETGIPYQSLINLYLRDCASQGKRLTMNWNTARAKSSA